MLGTYWCIHLMTNTQTHVSQTACHPGLMWCFVNITSNPMWSICITCHHANPHIALSVCLAGNSGRQPDNILYILVITNPLTTSDIDHVIPTELIINMTGSYNKEKKACALSKPCLLLCIKSHGHWMREITPLLSALPSSLSPQNQSCISFSNYPYSEPIFLASMFLPKGCVAEGLGMIS